MVYAIVYLVLHVNIIYMFFFDVYIVHAHYEIKKKTVHMYKYKKTQKQLAKQLWPNCPSLPTPLLWIIEPTSWPIADAEVNEILQLLF